MFNVSVLTAIWVANRNRPLNDSAGSVEISKNGDLVILDAQRDLVWSSNLSAPVANPSATLSDLGNLVLQDTLSGTYLWESFQHASDSFKEGMTMITDLRTNKTDMLASWKSPSDPAPGLYTVSVELHDTPQIVVLKGIDYYWRSGPSTGQIFTGVSVMNVKNFDFRTGLHLTSDNPEAASLTFCLDNASILNYFVLNSSGIIQRKLWSVEKDDWDETWSSIETECDVYGKCGPFGICNPRDRSICSCFRGFEPKNIDEWNAGNWTRGCKRRISHQCDKNSSNGDNGKQDGFHRMKGVKLPNNVNRPHVEEEDCGRECLKNCSCIAYSYYTGVGCMQWTEILIDVQQFSVGGVDLYIHLAHSELDNSKDWRAIATGTVCSFIFFIVCTYFPLKFYRGSKKKQKLIQTRFGESEAVNTEQNGVKLEEVPFFEFQVLLNATRNFDPKYKLGQGGFGPVYKGKLSNGQEIAVKRLARSSNQGLEEFKNEVEVISKLQHRKLVKLLGWCVENEEKMLVYEYMPNGSLDAYLFNSNRQVLKWNKQVLIIEGISRGLLYLHRDSRIKIIHRDLKASNILLDEELNPKISDFGMARIIGEKENQTNTNKIVGTFGYIAPEYAHEGRFSEKSDVFSFGVLLLEIVSGWRNSSFYNNEESQSLVAYAWKLWNEKNMLKFIDSLMFDPQTMPDILRCAHVGLLCVQESEEDRPSISTVVSMLGSEIFELPHPKKPGFIVHRISSQKQPPIKRSNKCSINSVTVTTFEGR